MYGGHVSSSLGPSALRICLKHTNSWQPYLCLVKPMKEVLWRLHLAGDSSLSRLCNGMWQLLGLTVTPNSTVPRDGESHHLEVVGWGPCATCSSPTSPHWNSGCATRSCRLSSQNGPCGQLSTACEGHHNGQASPSPHLNWTENLWDQLAQHVQENHPPPLISQQLLALLQMEREATPKPHLRILATLQGMRQHCMEWDNTARNETMTYGMRQHCTEWDNAVWNETTLLGMRQHCWDEALHGMRQCCKEWDTAWNETILYGMRQHCMERDNAAWNDTLHGMRHHWRWHCMEWDNAAQNETHFASVPRLLWRVSKFYILAAHASMSFEKNYVVCLLSYIICHIVCFASFHLITKISELQGASGYKAYPQKCGSKWKYPNIYAPEYMQPALTLRPLHFSYGPMVTTVNGCHLVLPYVLPPTFHGSADYFIFYPLLILILAIQ